MSKPNPVQELALAYAHTFNTEHGKLVWADLQALYATTPFFPMEGDKAVDPLRLAAKEGQRQVVLRIARLMGLAATVVEGMSMKSDLSVQQVKAVTEEINA